MAANFQDMNPKVRGLFKQYIDDLSNTCAEASWMVHSDNAVSERFYNAGHALAELRCIINRMHILFDEVGLWDDEM